MPVIINGTTGITDVNGTAAAPALTGTDTDTGIFFPAANTLAFSTNGTEDARFDSAGNFGLGVTPSANWTSAGSQKAMQVGNYGALSSSGTGVGGYYQTVLGMNCVDHTTSTKYLNTGVATAYVQATGQHQWLNAVSGTAGNAITFTQAMTLDASGNLGVGTTSPSYRLDISAASSNNAVTAVRAGSGYTSYVAIAGNGTTPLSSSFDLIQDGTNAYIYQRANAPIVFGTNNTERARIDSSGNLLVGTTSSAANVNGNAAIIRNGTGGSTSFCTSSTSATLVDFQVQGGIKGSISSTTSTTTYATSSDYRLKENIVPMTDALSVVAQLKPCKYTWKVDGSDGQGFIAHELQEIVPDAVTGEKDAVDEEGNPKYQGIDTSFLVATLTAAIQEQQAIITQLQADVAALKGNA